MRELLAVQGGRLELTRDPDGLTYLIELPCVVERSRRTVLLIDDNADLAGLYRSYCAGTGYDLDHLREGASAVQMVAAGRPDLILLDVMLPDVDGWDLLLDLHANPDTSAIPIIVCSVIPDEQLALDLGASLYLRKPVWRDLLIGSFDRVLAQAA